MGEIAEAVGKFSSIVVDSLTPRSVRLLLFAGLAWLFYAQWDIAEKLRRHDEVIQGIKASITEIQAYQKATLQRVEDGNADLQYIRRRMYDGKP